MNKQSFANVIKQIMEERNLNQLQLAGILGIRQSQISNWLNGKNLPGYSTLKLLMDKLDLSAEFLLQ